MPLQNLLEGDRRMRVCDRDLALQPPRRTAVVVVVAGSAAGASRALGDSSLRFVIYW